MSCWTSLPSALAVAIPSRPVPGQVARLRPDVVLLDVRTVEAHVNQIFQKLRLSTDPDSHRRVLAVLAYLRQPG